MTDMSDTIAPKSDQLNSDDLIAGPRTITITKVSRASTSEQPIAVNFEGDAGKPYMPCKSMRRVMVAVWGSDASQYIGRSLTLYRDPSVTWGVMEVGGIRISHMSDMDAPMVLALTATKKTRKPFQVLPLVVAAPEPPRRTLAQFLDSLEAELQAAETWDDALAILDGEDVQKAQEVAKGAMRERLVAMIDATRDRTRHGDE